MSRMRVRDLSKQVISSVRERPVLDSGHPQWSATENYHYRDVVMYDDNIWIALRDHTNHIPGAVEPLAPGFDARITERANKGTVTITGSNADSSLNAFDQMGAPPAGMVLGDYLLLDVGEVALPYTFTSGMAKGLTVGNSPYTTALTPAVAAGTITVTDSDPATPLFTGGDVQAAGDWTTVSAALKADTAKVRATWILNSTKADQTFDTGGGTLTVGDGDALIWLGDDRIGTGGYGVGTLPTGGGGGVIIVGTGVSTSNSFSVSHGSAPAKRVIGALALVDTTESDGLFGHGGWTFVNNGNYGVGVPFTVNRIGRVEYWKLVGLEAAESLAPWDSGRVYHVGDSVVHKNFAYVATDDINAGNKPSHAEMNITQISLDDFIAAAPGGQVIFDGADPAAGFSGAFYGQSSQALNPDLWKVGDIWHRAGEFTMLSAPQGGHTETGTYPADGEVYLYTGQWRLNGGVLGDDHKEHYFRNGWMRIDELSHQFIDYVQFDEEQNGGHAGVSGGAGTHSATELKAMLKPASAVDGSTMLTVPDLTHPFNPWQQLGLLPFIDTTEQPKDGATLIYSAKDDAWHYRKVLQLLHANTEAGLLANQDKRASGQSPAANYWDDQPVHQVVVTEDSETLWIKREDPATPAWGGDWEQLHTGVAHDTLEWDGSPGQLLDFTHGTAKYFIELQGSIYTANRTSANPFIGIAGKIDGNWVEWGSQIDHMEIDQTDIGTNNGLWTVAYKGDTNANGSGLVLQKSTALRYDMFAYVKMRLVLAPVWCLHLVMEWRAKNNNHMIRSHGNVRFTRATQGHWTNFGIKMFNASGGSGAATPATSNDTSGSFLVSYM